MACAVPMDIQEDQRSPQLTYYRASELVASVKGPLHDLLQKQPAVLGSLQIVSGLLCVGLGINFAVTQEMNGSLLTLFRVSHMTGSLFIIVGILSNLLFKCPRLLPVCFFFNLGSIGVAVVGAVLISIDLILWNHRVQNQAHWKMEVLVLCVLGLEVLLSMVLYFWFHREGLSHAD